jgi:hypothetical protein
MTELPADPGKAAAGAEPELMVHGYTHSTSRTGDVVTKVFRGPEAAAGCAREAAALSTVAGLLPVPRLIAAGPAYWHLVCMDRI